MCLTFTMTFNCVQKYYSQCLAAAVCLISLWSNVHTAPITVPSGAMPVPNGTHAAFSTRYPNPDITPALCQFEKRGDSNVVAIHQIHPPTSNKIVFIELATGYNPLYNDASEAILVDPKHPTNWEVVHTDESLFCGGHTLTSSGKIMQCGGHVERNVSDGDKNIFRYKEGLQGVRLLDALGPNKTFARVNTMKSKRWYPSVHLMSDGNIMILGGTTVASNDGDGVPFAEIFDPDNATAPMRVIPMPQRWMDSFETKPWYPIMWQLPTGHMFLFADKHTCIMNHQTGKCITNRNGTLVGPPPRPGNLSSTYPFTASGVMAKLVPDANNQINQCDIIIYGGTKRSEHPAHLQNWISGYNATALASRLSHRITISWKRADAKSPWQYTFSDWVEEDMGYPRVMPDATLLPNGDVVILNGAQAGVAGYPTSQGASQSQYPAFWASLYQTDAAKDRYTLLCGTDIPRGYHGTATLNIEGKIVINGHDRPRFYFGMSTVPWFVNGTGQHEPPEYMVEIFHPPYVYDKDNRPQIVTVAGLPGGAVAELGYNQTFILNYQPPYNVSKTDVTSVVLVAPSSTTHSCNMNQQVIQLNFEKTGGGELTVTTPAHPFYAAPQYYMIFVNNQKTYSIAKWVRLVDTQGLGQEIPLP